MKQPRIAVIGMACMFPKAGSLKEFWHVLRTGTDCITDIAPTHWNPADYHDADPRSPDRTYCTRGGFLPPVRFDPTEFSMPPSAIEATDTSQILGMVTAKAALEDAGYGSQRVFDRERTSVILGVTGCLELVIPLGARLGHPIWRRALQEAGVAPNVAEDVVRRIADAYVPWQENSFPGLLGNVVAGRISNRLNLQGTNCVVDAACASSHAAAHMAVMELACGRADMVVSGGVDTFNDIFMYMCFSKTPALSQSGEIRPFSDEADGTLLGEGIGMVVLKRLEDAQRDGDRVYAVICGVGTASDGEGQAIYAPTTPGQKRALQDAYRTAGVEPRTVGLVEAHGTGTKVGDAVEFEALKAVFGGSSEDRQWCALGAVKSQIGHTKAAAGVAALIKTALALHYKVLPPTLKVQRPNPKMDIENSPFYLNTKARPWFADGTHPRRAALSAFGFGGSNYHIVLEESDAARRDVAWDGSVELVALSALTRDDLAAALRDEIEADPANFALRAAASRQKFSSRHPFRLVAVIDRGAGQEPRTILEESSRRLRGERVKPASGVFVGEGPLSGAVAFLFPGQGSQYLDMGRDLACVFPEMLAAVPHSALGRTMYPPPAWTPQQEALQREALTRTDSAQPALGAMSIGCLDILERFGVRPQMVGGHSYGELPALHAAGCIDRAALHALSLLRGRLMAAAASEQGGSMLAVSAPAYEVKRILKEDNLDVALANHNSPQQVVLSGAHDALALASESCRKRGFAVQPLKVAAAFHSPLMAKAHEPFLEAVREAAFAAARIPVYANVTALPYPQDESAGRTLLADQLIRPVAFVEQIEHMYAAGAHVFVEVGAGAVLSGLVKATLGDRKHHAMSIDASRGRSSGLTDLARLLAHLAAVGAEVDLRAWETEPLPMRTKKMEVTLVGANYRSPRTTPSNGHNHVEPAMPPSVEAPPASPQTLVAQAPPHSLVAQAPPHSLVGQAPSPASVSAAPAPRLVAQAPPPAAVAAAPSNGFVGQAPRVPAAPVPPLAQTPPPADLLREAFQSVQSSVAAMAALQQQTANVHQRFLEGQELAQRTLQQVLEGQQRLVESALGWRVERPSTTLSPALEVPRVAPALITEASAMVLTGSNGTHHKPLEVRHEGRNGQAATNEAATKTALVAVATHVAAVPPPAAALPDAPPAAAVEAAILNIVAEKTGYPQEMLHLDMDLESELGIDSIKRVEILAALEERVPGTSRVETDRIGSLRTLRQVMDVLFAGLGQNPPRAPQTTAVPAPPASNNGSSTRLAEDTLLAVVAEKTGYPCEVLSLEMDLEADLGIDSIKRVEILASLEERLPGIQRLETSRIGSLRTLRQVVEALAGGSTAKATVETPLQAAGHPLPAAAPARAVERRVLRATSAPAPPLSRLRIAAGYEVRVVDDGGELAAALVEALRDSGVVSRLVSMAQAAAPHAAPVGGLVIVTPEGDLERFLKKSFRLVASLGPQLRRAAAEGGALLATVTRMDGAFGLVGGSFDPMQGGLSGLPKTAAHEWPQVSCRALDVAISWRDGQAAARAVVRELATDGPLEVGLDATDRRVLQAAVEPVRGDRVALRAADVVVISGGARGVTAEVAVALARHTQPTLVMLGRSAAPAAEPSWLQPVRGEGELKRAILQQAFNGSAVSPTDLEREYRKCTANREILETLRRVEECGARVAYLTVDVRDEAAVAAAMEQIRRTYGPIRGLVHAAGVLADRRLEDKTPQQFDAVFDTKVAGLTHLMRATANDDLRLLVLFSSVTARYGRPGQVDYCMANEVMNKVAQQEARRRADCRVVAMNWGPWEGGMVTDALRAEFQRLGVGLIPKESGALALVAELRHAGNEAEVLIGDGFPEPPTAAVSAAPPTHDMMPLMDVALSLHSHPFLESHCLAGRAVVPLAAIVEWMGHAALHGNVGMRFFGTDDLKVLKAITLESDPTVVRFLASAARETAPGEMLVQVEMRHAETNLLYVRGTVILRASLPAAPHGEPPTLVGPHFPHSVSTVYESLLFHGPHFYALSSIGVCSRDGMEAQVKAAPRPLEWMRQPLRTEWLGDPLMVDGGLQLGVLWSEAELGMPALPVCGAHYRQYRPFPRDGARAVLSVRKSSPLWFVADLDFLDGNDLVARAEGFEWVASPSLMAAFKPAVAVGTASA